MSILLEATGTVKFAVVNASSSGNNTVIAAATGKKFRVLSYVIVTTTAVTAQWASGTSPTALSGAMALGATGGVSANFNPAGHVETAEGEALVLVLGGAIQASGHVTYQEIIVTPS